MAAGLAARSSSSESSCGLEGGAICYGLLMQRGVRANLPAQVGQVEAVNRDCHTGSSFVMQLLAGGTIVYSHDNCSTTQRSEHELDIRRPISGATWVAGEQSTTYTLMISIYFAVKTVLLLLRLVFLGAAAVPTAGTVSDRHGLEGAGPRPRVRVAGRIPTRSGAVSFWIRCRLVSP